VADGAEQGGAHPVDPGQSFRLDGARGGAVHGQARRGGDQQVDDQGDDVVGGVHGQRAVGRQEEPVDHQRGGHRGAEGRPESAGGRGDQHRHQVEQHHAGQGQAGAEGQQRHRPGGQAEQGGAGGDPGPARSRHPPIVPHSVRRHLITALLCKGAGAGRGGSTLTP
jgi:hypothetical protein